MRLNPEFRKLVRWYFGLFVRAEGLTAGHALPHQGRRPFQCVAKRGLSTVSGVGLAAGTAHVGLLDPGFADLAGQGSSDEQLPQTAIIPGGAPRSAQVCYSSQSRRTKREECEVGSPGRSAGERIVDGALNDVSGDWEEWLAKPMFLFAVIFLVLLSGLIREGHHFNAGMAATMLWLYLGGLLLLWPLFLVEGALRVFFLSPPERSIKNITLTLVPSLLPPLRMAVQGVRRPGEMWLPGLGWQVVDYDLRKTLELFFSVPMIFMALLILPVLAVEYYWHFWLEPMESEPWLRAFLDICTCVIWIAFTAEFIIRMRHCRKPLAVRTGALARSGCGRAADDGVPALPSGDPPHCADPAFAVLPHLWRGGQGLASLSRAGGAATAHPTFRRRPSAGGVGRQGGRSPGIAV